MIDFLQAAISPAGLFDLDCCSVIENRDLLQVVDAGFVEFGKENAAGALETVPGEKIAVVPVDMVGEKVA